MRDLYVVDGEFRESMTSYPQHAEKIDSLLRKFCSILESLESERYIEGKMAESVSAFAGLVRSILEGEIVGVLEEYSGDVESYLATVFDDDEVKWVM